MQPDPQRARDTFSWLQKALNDLRYARIDLEAEPPAPEDAVFHCQQAVEKALKAFLVWHDVPFPKTHDLGKLGSQVVAVDAGLDPMIEQTVELTKYAWLFRYPGDPATPNSDEAAGALMRATAAVDAIAARVSGPGSPIGPGWRRS